MMWWRSLAVWLFLGMGLLCGAEVPAPKRLAYLVSDLRIPFWSIMARGIEAQSMHQGYSVQVYSAQNSSKQELENAAAAIREKVDGIIVSPTNSSACVTILKMAQQAGIPVVISDIGTDGGTYLSYIASNNRDGAYAIGQILARSMIERGWQEGRVGIIAIPQKRANGQARTAGFMEALRLYGIKGADIRQQVDFSYRETYDFARELIAKHPDLWALWLQGSDRYRGALDAIADAGKQGQILLVCFDAEPEFTELIERGTLLAAAMQQPYLMGEEAVLTFVRHWRGESVIKEQSLSVLAVSTDTVAAQMGTIRRNVLGLESPSDKAAR
ncbi:MAG: substrate-binding domain-containing protein [Campylobacterales bacterium]|nr:substrate-binding domain-containing protein [Campylobacterales bacterium]